MVHGFSEVRGTETGFNPATDVLDSDPPGVSATQAIARDVADAGAPSGIDPLADPK